MTLPLEASSPSLLRFFSLFVYVQRLSSLELPESRQVVDELSELFLVLCLEAERIEMRRVNEKEDELLISIAV